jgi:hypothetical protein
MKTVDVGITIIGAGSLVVAAVVGVVVVVGVLSWVLLSSLIDVSV